MKQINIMMIMMSLIFCLLSAHENVLSNESTDVYIGNPDSTALSVTMPFNFYYKNNLVQSIYYEDEINMIGVITAVTYRYYAHNAPAEQAVKIWMATIDSDFTGFQTTTSWIPFSEFTLVYDGFFDASISGDQTLVLDVPFYYGAGNLVLMTNRVFGSFYSSENNFQITAYPNSSRSIHKLDDTIEIFPEISYPEGSILDNIPNTKFLFQTSGFGTLRGTVTSDELPLEGVKISVNGTSRFAMTDALGVYEIPYLAPGTIDITASKFLYIETQELDVVISAEEETIVNFNMEPAGADLHAISLSGYRTPSVGITYTYTVTIQNIGGNKVYTSDYSVQLMKATVEGSDEVLVETDGPDIDSAETVEIPFLWTPDDIGEYFIYANIIIPIELDENQDNNMTPHIQITVYPEVIDFIYLGNPESTFRSNAAPFNFYYRNNISQSIYYEEDIHVRGLITTLGYRYFAVDAPPDQPVKVWMTTVNTDITNFPTGDSWIPYNEFSLVYDGVFDASFTGDHVLTLDHPFPYSGGNLVIMTNRQFGSWYSETNAFQITEYPGLNRTLRVNTDDFTLDPENPPGGGRLTSVPNTSLTFVTRGLGTLSGRVTVGGEPLEGVTVRIDGTQRTALTNSNGEYTLLYLNEGIINITASKFGYFDKTETNITIEPEQTSIRDIEMNLLTLVKVSGIVYASDTVAPLSAVSISLTGYSDYYDIITNVEGAFEINDVYGGFVYTITIYAHGYDILINDTIEVGLTDLDLGIITVYERPFPPRLVTAVNEGNTARVTWEAPRIGNDVWITHITDENIADAWGGPAGIPVVAAHRYTNAQLRALGVIGGDLSVISLFIAATADLSQMTMFLKVYTGGSNNPWHPGNEMVSQPINTTNLLAGVWNDIELFRPVEIPQTGELWFGYEVHWHGTGSNPSMPITDEFNGNVGFGDIVCDNEGWGTIYDKWAVSGYRFEENFMIKGMIASATGTSVLSQNDTYRQPLNPVAAICDCQIPVAAISDCHISHSETGTTEITEGSGGSVIGNSSRVLEGYRAWRLKIDDLNNEDAWTPIEITSTDLFLIDNGWSMLPSDTYYFAVKAVYTDDNLSKTAFSNPVFKAVSTDPNTVPIVTNLGLNFPNPFNPTTVINFTNAKEGNITIEIFNIRGQKIKTLVNDHYSIGEFSVSWNGNDDHDRAVSSGIYFYQMKTESLTQTRRMVLMK